MSCEPLLPGVGFGAAQHLAPVDRFVCVTLGVTLEVLLPSEGFVTVFALVDSLYLDTSPVHLHMLLRSVKCHNLSRENINISALPSGAPPSYLAILLRVEFVLGERVSRLVSLELLSVEIIVLDHLSRLGPGLAPGRQGVVLSVMTAGEGGVVGVAVTGDGPLGPDLASLGLLLLLLLMRGLMLVMLLRLLRLLVMMMIGVYRQHGVEGGGVVVVGGGHGLYLPGGVPRHGEGHWPGLVLLAGGGRDRDRGRS